MSRDEAWMIVKANKKEQILSLCWSRDNRKGFIDMNDWSIYDWKEIIWHMNDLALLCKLDRKTINLHCKAESFAHIDFLNLDFREVENFDGEKI